MVTTQRTLIVEPDECEAARFSQLVADHGCAATTVRSAAEAVARLADEPADLIVLGERLAAADHQAVARAAGQHDAALLLAVGGEPLPQHWETALRLGCAALLRADADGAAVQAALGNARARRQSATQTREEVRRHKYQSEELRKRCAQQAERFQETQETFFLDLSRMMTIITNIMDGIVFVDRGGNVTLLNPVAEDLLGAKSFVAIGKPMAAMQGRTELVTALNADHQRLQGQKEVAQTVEVHHNEQDLLYIKCITSRVYDYRGHAAGTLSVLKDVTAEFKTDQLKNQYLSIVAHELRTPLTGIKTFSTMMAKGSLGPLSDRQQRVCESMREQALRLEHQIDKLINLGNLESADYGRDREVIPVTDFAAGLLLPFEQSTRDRRIAVTFHDESTDQNLFADRADLRRACQALVENEIGRASCRERVSECV